MSICLLMVDVTAVYISKNANSKLKNNVKLNTSWKWTNVKMLFYLPKVTLLLFVSNLKVNNLECIQIVLTLVQYTV